MFFALNHLRRFFSKANIFSPIIDIINKARGSEHLLATVKSIRIVLSREKNPPIDDVIKANLVQSMVKNLENSESVQIQFEAAWVLTNIVSGTSLQTKHVVESGAVKPLIKLISSANQNVCEQAICALGNIIGDGPELRDIVIKFGIIDPLLALVRPDTPNEITRNIVWSFLNVCRNKNPAVPMNVLEQILPALSSLLYSNDNEIVKNACWAFSYITDNRNEKIDAVIKTGILFFN